MRTTYYRVTQLTESIFRDTGNKSDISETNPKGIGKQSVPVSDESPKDNNTIDNNKEDSNESTPPLSEMEIFKEVLRYLTEKSGNYTVNYWLSEAGNKPAFLNEKK